MPFNVAPGVELWTREDWKADPAHPRVGHLVPREARTHVIIHHTVLVDPDPSPNVWEEDEEIRSAMRKLQTIRPDLDLDVPYNFVVFLRPKDRVNRVTVCEGRGEDRSGAHTYGHNTKGIGIAFMGNFEKAVSGFAKDYIPYVNLFLGWLQMDPNAQGYGGPWDPMQNLGSKFPIIDDGQKHRNVYIHRDFKATACPGGSIAEVADQFNFTNPALPPEPEDPKPGRFLKLFKNRELHSEIPIPEDWHVIQRIDERGNVFIDVRPQ